MKKPFMVICAGAMLALLAGCSSNYVMTTKSGQTIVTHGKPQLDKETGMTSYIDESGNKREINSSDVSQLVEDNCFDLPVCPRWTNRESCQLLPQRRRRAVNLMHAFTHTKPASHQQYRQQRN